jgi:hypothetical protein
LIARSPSSGVSTIALDERTQLFERLRLQRFVFVGWGKLSGLLTTHPAQVGGEAPGPGGNPLCGFLIGEQDLPLLGPDLHLVDERRRIHAFQDSRLGARELD